MKFLLTLLKYFSYVCSPTYLLFLLELLMYSNLSSVLKYICQLLFKLNAVFSLKTVELLEELCSLLYLWLSTCRLVFSCPLVFVISMNFVKSHFIVPSPHNSFPEIGSSSQIKSNNAVITA